MRKEERIMRIAFLTLGCKVNSYETDKMKNKFIEAGDYIVSFEEEADIYLVNTCTVTNIADRKSRQMLHRAKKKNPQALIVATGCYVDSALAKDEQDESVMLTNDNSIVSIEAIYQYTIRDVKQYYFDVDDPEGTLQLAFEAIIRRNIQNRPLDDALLNKEEIERQVLPDFQALIDTYEMGVKINDVRIQNITVPAAVSAAYEDVNNAKNEKTKRLDEVKF